MVATRMAPQPSPLVPAPPVTLRLVSAPAPPTSREPQWVGRSWEATKREVRRYLATSWAFAARPRETARLWAEGRFDAQNPLAYVLNTAAVLGPWRALWQYIFHLQQPLWEDILWAAAPTLGILLNSSFTHLLVALAGGKRRLTSSWAMSIYVTGGFLLVFQLAATPFLLISDHIKTPQDWRDHWLAFVLGQVLILPGYFWHSIALAGLHGLRARRVVLAQVLGAVACVLLAAWAGFELIVLVRTYKHGWH